MNFTSDSFSCSHLGWFSCFTSTTFHDHFEFKVLRRAPKLRRLERLQEIHRSENLGADGCPDRTCWSLSSMPLRPFCCGLLMLSILACTMILPVVCPLKFQLFFFGLMLSSFGAGCVAAFLVRRAGSFRSYKVGLWLCHCQLDSSHVVLTGNEQSTSRVLAMHVWSDTR